MRTFRVCYFNPRSPHGERRSTSTTSIRDGTFQSTLPARGATRSDVRRSRSAKQFQSTLPARGATLAPVLCGGREYFNPRSPHGERLELRGLRIVDLAISIHAPRTGSDFSCAAFAVASSPFQSTLPARGATIHTTSLLRGHIFQSTLPARGATQRRKASYPHISISIHAPRTGSDIRLDIVLLFPMHFNPRSPHGERPKTRTRRTNMKIISIHAPRTGSDG